MWYSLQANLYHRRHFYEYASLVYMRALSVCTGDVTNNEFSVDKIKCTKAIGQINYKTNVALSLPRRRRRRRPAERYIR